MELHEAKEILRSHNKWRRDVEDKLDLDMVDPIQLGIAIDTILDFLDFSA